VAEGKPTLALFGGTFDPIHLGHLRAAQEVVEELHLDRVVFMPCADPPFCKPVRADASHRLEMMRRATADNPRFLVSDIEVARGGKSYAVDTLEALAAQNPQSRLLFLIGADAFFSIHSWRQVLRLFELADFVVMTRPGAPGRDIREYLERYVDPAFAQAPDGWVRLPEGGHGARRATVTLLDISSTDIKRRAKEGLSLAYLVPPPVEEYIKHMNLYGYLGALN
jgi:nicotinate-nucleotide adenylyltransferase